MRGQPTLLHLLVCIFNALQWDIISQTSLKITKAIYLSRFFNKTSASVLFLEFRYFELRNIYKRNPSPIRIPIISVESASSFIDSGAGFVLSIWFVLAVVEQRKQISSCQANSLGVVYPAVINPQIIYVFTDNC